MAETEYNIHKYVFIVYNHLKMRIVAFSLPKIKPFLSGEGKDESHRAKLADFPTTRKLTRLSRQYFRATKNRYRQPTYFFFYLAANEA